jgi:hypothetical protein
LLLVATVLTLAAISLPARANSTGSLADDWANDVSPGPYGPITSEAKTDCDTIDPNLSLSRYQTIYKCIRPSNLVSWQLETIDRYSSGFRPDLDVGARDAFKGTWVFDAGLPTTVQELKNLGLTSFGLSAYIVFENHSVQDGRQKIGFNFDCDGYEHDGPFLTGDGMKEFLYWSIIIDPDPDDPEGNGVLETITTGVGFFDGGTFNIYLPRLPNSAVSSCEKTGSGATAVWTPKTISHPGTDTNAAGALNYTLSSDRKTLSMIAPFHYRRYSSFPATATRLGNNGWQNRIEQTWDWARPGDLLTNINARIAASTPFAGVPGFNRPKCNPGDPPPDNLPAPACTHVQGIPDAGQPILTPNGIGLEGTVDWAPASAWDLGGLLGDPGEFLANNCPDYGVITTDVTQINANILPIGPNGEDREIQYNPLFDPNAPPLKLTPPYSTNGISHYDSSGQPGSHTNDIAPAQDHNGPVACFSVSADLSPPQVFDDGGFKPTGVSLTA